MPQTISERQRGYFHTDYLERINFQMCMGKGFRAIPHFPFGVPVLCSETLWISLALSLLVERTVNDTKVRQTWNLSSNGLESKSCLSSNQLLICRDVILIRQVEKTVLHARRAIKSLDRQSLA